MGSLVRRAPRAVPLTERQLQLLEIVNQLETESVALGGGAALIDAGLVDRPTQDLDFFSNDLEAITPFADELILRLREYGSDVEVLRRSPGFVQLVADGVLVDIAQSFSNCPTSRIRSPSSHQPSSVPLPPRLLKCGNFWTLVLDPRWTRAARGVNFVGIATIFTPRGHLTAYKLTQRHLISGE